MASAIGTSVNRGRKTVRLWIYHNGGPVRLAIRDGHPIRITTGGMTDEGWEEEHQALEYDEAEQIVTCSVDMESQDCDGRHSCSSEYYCPVSDLAKREPFDESTYTAVATRNGYKMGKHIPPHDFLYPEWTSGGCESRDYTAEESGY